MGYSDAVGYGHGMCSGVAMGVGVTTVGGDAKSSGGRPVKHWEAISDHNFRCARLCLCRLGAVQLRRRLEEALEVFSQMRPARVEPDAAAYAAAIAACERCGDAARALGLLRDLRRRGVAPSAAAYTSAIAAAARGPEPGEALDVLAEMRAAGAAPTAATQTAAAVACERLGRWAEALAMLGADGVPWDVPAAPWEADYNKMSWWNAEPPPLE